MVTLGHIFSSKVENRFYSLAVFLTKLCKAAFSIQGASRDAKTDFGFGEVAAGSSVTATKEKSHTPHWSKSVFRK